MASMRAVSQYHIRVRTCRETSGMLAPAMRRFITVMGLNFLGDALRDALDPMGYSKAAGGRR